MSFLEVWDTVQQELKWPHNLHLFTKNLRKFRNGLAHPTIDKHAVRSAVTRHVLPELDNKKYSTAEWDLKHLSMTKRLKNFENQCYPYVSCARMLASCP